jgi:ribonuclease Z
MKTIIQFFGAGSREIGSHSLYMFLDQHRMLVNASEGTQRISTQHRLKLAPNRLSTILLTRLDWECIGGLPGLILTMADSSEALKNHPDASRLRTAKAPVLRIVGPRHLKHAIAAMRPFLHRHNFVVEVEEVEAAGESVHFFDAKTGVNYWALELSTRLCEAQTAASELSLPRKRSCLEQVENLVMEEFGFGS